MKDKKLEIRITQYEARQLEQEAIRRGMTKSELVRSLIARFPAPV
ncbi:MAG TPA: ribbon-helix-helix protein, CopG family [Oculatellaceae cyanobacterium]